MVTVVDPPDMTITKSHNGNFQQTQVGAIYTITATNSGGSATTAPVSVVDTLPASGLTATALAGTGWACTLATLTCTDSTVLAAGLGYSPITLTVTVAGNAPASVTNTAVVSGGGETNTANDTATDLTTITPALPDMTITKSHNGNFSQNQVGAMYTITATNSGLAPTTAAVNVVDTLPASLTATAMTGTGWVCTVATLTCTRSDVLAAGASYPAITLTVTVASNAPASVTNTAVVSGGGETNFANDTAMDATTITPTFPDMTITKSHVGNFTQGQAVGATYTITVSNVGVNSTNAAVSMVDTLPASLTATVLTGTGWTCTLGTLTCTRSDVLAAGASYPAITLTVTVAANAGASVTNTAVVSGGGETNFGTTQRTTEHILFCRNIPADRARHQRGCSCAQGKPGGRIRDPGQCVRHGVRGGELACGYARPRRSRRRVSVANRGRPLFARPLRKEGDFRLVANIDSFGSVLICQIRTLPIRSLRGQSPPPAVMLSNS